MDATSVKANQTAGDRGNAVAISAAGAKSNKQFEIGREKEYRLISQICDTKFSDRILATLNAGLQKSPDAIHLLREKVQLLRRLGRHADALGSLKVLIAAAPDDAAAAELMRIFSGGESNVKKTDWYAPAPFVRLKQPLSSDVADQLLQLAVQEKDCFRTAGMNSSSGTYTNTMQRDALVLYELADFRARFETIVKTQLPDVFRRLNIAPVEPTKIELKITNHLNGHFFRTHKDDERHEQESDYRVISFLFYFHQVPKAFCGGDLLLFDTNSVQESYKPIQFTRIPCDHNTMVFFPSRCFHCVEPVRMDVSDFSFGRFAVGGHVRIAQ